MPQIRKIGFFAVMLLVFAAPSSSIYSYFQPRAAPERSSAESALGDVAPTAVGECVTTDVAEIENRLRSGPGEPFEPGTGSAILYSNGVYQVSIDQIPAIDQSRAGDPIRLCLKAFPENCPPGDERGIVYTASNFRTGQSWALPNSSDVCGGA